jgi:hypothetical protein
MSWDLQLGQGVPADLRLLAAAGLECDESVLTGESEPTEKAADPVAAGMPLAELSCCALMGTVVSAGSGTEVAVATGGAAEFDRLADAALELILDLDLAGLRCRHATIVLDRDRGHGLHRFRNGPCIRGASASARSPASTRCLMTPCGHRARCCSICTVTPIPEGSCDWPDPQYRPSTGAPQSLRSSASSLKPISNKNHAGLSHHRSGRRLWNAWSGLASDAPAGATVGERTCCTSR